MSGKHEASLADLTSQHWFPGSKTSRFRLSPQDQTVVQIFVTDSLMTNWASKSPKELIEAIDGFSTLTDAVIELSHQSGGYDGCDYGLDIEGWRTATPEEIDAGLRELEMVKAAAERHQESQVEALRRQRPDLFK